MMINCGNRLCCVQHAIQWTSIATIVPNRTVEWIWPRAREVVAKTWNMRDIEWEKKRERKNCIHSIKYKYLTETMYLRYLLISNIKSKKWLEGQNPKLSIYINAMCITNTYNFSVNFFFHIVLDFDCESIFFFFSHLPFSSDFIFPFSCTVLGICFFFILVS